MAEMLRSAYSMAENSVGKGGNASFDHFLFFPHCY